MNLYEDLVVDKYNENEKQLLKLKLRQACRALSIPSLVALPFIRNKYFFFFTVGLFVNRNLGFIGDVFRRHTREKQEEERKQNKYLYCIKDIAEHTETGEVVMIYQAMYAPFKTYARPLSMFLEEVDHKKYPDIKQKYRFERLKTI